MRTVITGSSLFIVTAICILIHCSIISSNIRNYEVHNGLDQAIDYAIDILGDIYARGDFDRITNEEEYLEKVANCFCEALNNKIVTDGEISIKFLNAELESGTYEILVTETYQYPIKGKKGRCSCDKTFILS